MKHTLFKIEKVIGLLNSSSKVQEKTCFQNKSKFITEDHFVKHVNITIHELNTNEPLIKTK
jgi:hypothetical protein